MSNRIVRVLGGGGHAKVLIRTLLDLEYRILEIRDDNSSAWGKALFGVPIVGPIAECPADAPAVIAVGDNISRAKIAASLKLDWQTVVHPRAFVDRTVRLGAGTVVFANATIQPDTSVGNHVIVNTAASIDHDGSLGNYCHVAPGVHLCGNVKLGEGVLLGVGTVAAPGVSVGPWTVVGAGSAVLADLPSRCRAWGTPATIQGEIQI